MISQVRIQEYHTKKTRVDQTLNTCTPELLDRAGLPQDFYVAGADLVWDVVNGWLNEHYVPTELPEQEAGDTFKTDDEAVKTSVCMAWLIGLNDNVRKRQGKWTMHLVTVMMIFELVFVKFMSRHKQA